MKSNVRSGLDTREVFGQGVIVSIRSAPGTLTFNKLMACVYGFIVKVSRKIVEYEDIFED